MRQYQIDHFRIFTLLKNEKLKKNEKREKEDIANYSIHSIESIVKEKPSKLFCKDRRSFYIE